MWLMLQCSLGKDVLQFKGYKKSEIELCYLTNLTIFKVSAKCTLANFLCLLRNFIKFCTIAYLMIQ